MSPEERARLAARQAELVLCLTGRGGPPEGFDPDRLLATSRALSGKRSRSVARAWPSLARALGGDFEPLFSAYADEASPPRLGGPLADGRNFVRALARRGRLPDAARLEALAVDLHYASRPTGLVPRRGPALAIAALAHSGRLVLAVHWPGLGFRRLSIPLPRLFPLRQRPPDPATRLDGSGPGQQVEGALGRLAEGLRVGPGDTPLADNDPVNGSS